jgi:glycosyltransferase involved in cell wall biosynthesis
LSILYFIEPVKNRDFGGVAEVAYNLPKALAKKIGVTYFPAFVRGRSYAASLLARARVFRSLALKDFDIVHFNVIPGWINGRYMLFKFAKISGTSTILIIHGIIQREYILYGWGTMTDPSVRRFWLNSYKSLASTLRCCKIADKIVTYSEFMRTSIVTWYGVNHDKIAVIPNGVDVRKFSECNSELSLEGDPAILYLGDLAKGSDSVIQATARLRSELPKMRLHLVGLATPWRAALERLAKKEDVEKHVVFHGFVSPEKTPQYYKAADICVFPSRRDIEIPAGITLLEAMASGTPVIASNRGGTPEIISHGKNGILFEPEDADALPKAILALHQDSESRKTISHNALKTVAKYSWEKIAEKYVSLYKHLRK